VKNRHLLAVTLAIVFSVPVCGQAKTGKETKAENIHRLMTLIRIETLQQSMLDQMMAALAPMITNSANTDPQEQKILQRMSVILAEELKKTNFSSLTAELYDKYFTNEEITGLIQFYQSPVGQKAVQVLPKLSEESLARGMEMGQQAAVRALSRLAEEYPQLERALNSGNK
jgi:hypothetical protein